LRLGLNPPIDNVDVEKALVLVLEERFVATPKDDADNLFESVGQGPRRAVGHEAELANRAHHLLARLGTRSPEAVEHA